MPLIHTTFNPIEISGDALKEAIGTYTTSTGHEPKARYEAMTTKGYKPHIYRFRSAEELAVKNAEYHSSVALGASHRLDSHKSNVEYAQKNLDYAIKNLDIMSSKLEKVKELKQDTVRLMSSITNAEKQGTSLTVEEIRTRIKEINSKYAVHNMKLNDIDVKKSNPKDKNFTKNIIKGFTTTIDNLEAKNNTTSLIKTVEQAQSNLDATLVELDKANEHASKFAEKASQVSAKGIENRIKLQKKLTENKWYRTTVQGEKRRSLIKFLNTNVYQSDEDVKNAMVGMGFNENDKLVRQIMKLRTLEHINTMTQSIIKNNNEAGKVYAFEIQPKIYNLFLQNIKANNLTSIIVPIFNGLGDFHSIIDLLIPKDYDTNENPGGISLLNKNHSDKDDKINTSIITLDSLNLNNVSIMKIDVEGYEIEALTGALDTIQKNKPIIILEIWPENKEKYFEWFKSNLSDYDIETLNGWDYLLKPKN